MKTDRIKGEIHKLIEEYYGSRPKELFVPGKTKIPLIAPAYGHEEVNEALDSLLDGQVTMGEKVKRFERAFADYIGVKYAIMVTSGSTANSLALAVLTNPAVRKCIKPGNEIITPAVTWATTVFPILNFGAVPVLVDVDLDTFNLNVDEVEKAITPKTKAIMLVHLLGNPCNMGKLMEIARKHNLFVVEDSCEAHGAEFNGQKVGSFGDLATFSFFFSHHITTIEGGMVLTNNEQFAELARGLRVFGWIRDLKDKENIARRHKIIDPRFLFINVGYNFRAMETQGGFGIHQIKKLEGFIDVRRENSRFWSRELQKYAKYFTVHTERPGTRHVWFGYPITINRGAPFTRAEMMAFLEKKMVETRPIMAGNIAEQPAMRLVKDRYVKAGSLPNARYIMRNSFFFGNHQEVGKLEREAIVDYIEEFLSGE